MSLPVTEAAFLAFVADTIEDGTAKRPDREVVYHGILPDDCCSDAGTLAVWHEKIAGSDEFPVQWSGRGAKSTGWPLVTLVARLSTCWPIPKRPAGGGVILADPDWTERAKRLALVDEVVCTALIGLSCGQPPGSAVLAELHCDQFRFIDAVPTKPSGGCAALTWRAFASIAPDTGS